METFLKSLTSPILGIDATYVLKRSKFSAIKRLNPTKNEDGTEVPPVGDYKDISSRFIGTILKLVNVLSAAKFTNTYLLWDYGFSTYRTNIDSEYKGDRVYTQDYASEQYSIAKDKLLPALSSLGFVNIRCHGVEADDLGYFLTTLFPSGVLCSDDWDWILNISNPNFCLYRTYADEHWERHHIKELVGYHPDDNSISDDKAYDIYKTKKALVGGDDNIIRLESPKAGTDMARRIELGELTEKDRTKLNEEKYKLQYETNRKLVDTSFLSTDPQERAVLMRALAEGHSASNKSGFEPDKFRAICSDLGWTQGWMINRLNKFYRDI